MDDHGMPPLDEFLRYGPSDLVWHGETGPLMVWALCFSFALLASTVVGLVLRGWK